MVVENFPMASKKPLPRKHGTKSGNLTENFSDYEFKCPCCGLFIVDKELLRRLQAIRDKLGKPIKIESGYRCPKHNRKIPGAAPNSTHLYGWAVDINTPDGKYALDLLMLAIEEGFRRIEIKRGNIHLDVGDIMDGDFYRPGLFYPNK